jgi:ATP-dependent DNA helicase RecG
MKSKIDWNTPLQYIKGIGPYKSTLLKRIGLSTAEDLLFYLPYRYEDRTTVKKIAQLTLNEVQMVSGEIKGVRSRITSRKHFKIFELILGDETGLLVCKWFNQPYLEKLFKPGERIILTGKVALNRFEGNRPEMAPLSYEVVNDAEDQALHHGKFVPIYHETEGMTSKHLRSLVKTLLDDGFLLGEKERIPLSLIQKFRFPSQAEALREVHFPSSRESFLEIAGGKSIFHQRLVFEDFFLLEVGLTLRKNRNIRENKGLSFDVKGEIEDRLLQRLSFQLTSAQKRVLEEIKKDMGADSPMSRLLQGDVGSGKTVIALISMLIAIENGYQACFMVPTEILAEQHFFNFLPLLGPLNISAGLLTNSIGKKEQIDTLQRIADGRCQLIIGTHSLVQERVLFKKLGLTVIDEQHKFGVRQRLGLKKKGESPDMLIMTATPIPRTLALTVYGDLDLSVLDELPPGRKTIQTRQFYDKQRNTAYSLIEKEIKEGRQVYIVYPLIEESEKLDLKAAVTMAEHLRSVVFPSFNIGLLHGKMKPEEKEKTMRAFKEKELHILVSTTVIEVGIDVSNASLMVIEHAERFGLAQLHQLRGRVGRGPFQSYCFLMAQYPLSYDAKRRLKAMVNSSNGFELAEEDLSIRGPGEFFGTRQSGLPELRVASLLRDGKMLEVARREAIELLQKDALLTQPENRGLKEVLLHRWKEKLDLISMG